METISKDEQKPQCPICRKQDIHFDDKDKQNKIRQGRGGRRRNKNRLGSINSSSEDSQASIQTNDDSSYFIGEKDPTFQDVEGRTEINYKYRLKAFDDDYSLSMPSIVFE
mmetsp:Transcript_12591/g.11128  ORF Transcript_12591/g.11128 Transcript_12591/m.11128 type:complete len:110 (+) Transcript_12591:1396-1725(+)